MNIPNPTAEQIRAAQDFQRRAVEENWQNTDLGRLSDNALAHWQAQQKPSSREFVLAAQQWRIRLLNRQLRASRWLAAIGCATTLAGVGLGYWLRLMNERFEPSGPRQEPPKTAVVDQKAP